MNNFSKFVGVTALSMSLIVPAFAEATSPVVSQTTNNELAYAFGANTDLQAKSMTNHEMQDTQGAWIANAVGGVLGGLGGHFGYMAGSIGSDSYSAKNHLTAVGLGAVGGAANPVAGLGSAVATFGLTGATTGVSTYIGNKAPLTNIHK